MGQPRKTWERRVRVEMEGAYSRAYTPRCIEANAMYRVQRYHHSPNLRKYERWQDTLILYLGGLDGLGSTALFRYRYPSSKLLVL